MTSYYRFLNVQIESHKDIIQPNMTNKKDFYKLFSPKSFKLAPRQDIYLDLKFRINTPAPLGPWINLLPSLKGLGLKIENEDWASKKTKDNTIQLHILSRSFTRTISIKNRQVIAFIFLLVEQVNDKITTEYSKFS